MKSLKSFSIAATAIFLFAAPDLQARPPVLTVGGKETPDVFLQSLDIQVEVTGSIASTRYTMVFKNRTDRELEGELTFPLPDGRTATHYALDINGRMRDAVPVEKARATEVFEEIQRRVQVIDPGILERVEGNNFRTRIYPFPRNGTRTISIGYEEELPLENGLLRYRLPMAYPKLENFSVKATVWKSSQKPIVPDDEDEIRFDRAGKNYVAAFTRRNYQPARALNFALPAPADIPQVMMQSAQGSYYFLASVAPNMEIRKKRWSDELAIIWDVSLSGRQRNLRREMEMLDVIFADKKSVDVHLYFLSNTFGKNVNKNNANGGYKVVDGDWGELKNVLEAAVYDGGTDFSRIDLKNVAGDEILFFSDGISTLSDADFLGIIVNNGAASKQGRPQGSPLHDRVSDVCRGGACPRPIHCVVSSSKADYSAMKLIAGRTKGKFINVNALSPEKLKTELLNETLQFLGTEHGDAVREIYPGIATPVHGNFSVAGISDADDAELTLLFGFGNTVEKQVEIKLDAKDADTSGNIYKIWAQKKIAELDLDYEKNRAELTELGQQFGIVTRNTSLIVLEFVSDYVLFNIEPPASEPGLLAEYQRLRKGRKERQRDAERVMLNAAIEAANDLKQWWNTSGSPPPAKPDILRSRLISDFEMLRGGEGLQPVRDNLYSPREAGSSDEKQTKPASDDSQSRTSSPGESLSKSSGDDSRSRVLSSDASLSKSSSADSHVRLPDENQPKPASGDSRSQARSPDENRSKPASDDSHSPDASLPKVKSRSSGKDKPAKASKAAAGKNFTFESAEVIGYLDTPTPIYVVDMDDPNADPVTLDRSMLYYLGLDRYGDNFHESYYRCHGASARSDNAKDKGKLSMEIKPFGKDRDYLKEMTGELAKDYQTYLKLRDKYAGSPSFYFDMANWFYTHNHRETALRILTSIAELELEDASLYRMLGYRLKEYGEYALQKFVCRKVVQWRPMEPQSYRDYALALADNGETQAALDSLHALLTKSYSASISRRSAGIEEVVITEMNRLIAQNPELDVSGIDKRLIMDMPVDIRVVINWNLNNTSINLYVKDPCFEMPLYDGYWKSKITGGRFNSNFTNSGYGPSQYLLKRAINGKFHIHVNYYSAREFAAPGPATVMAEIYTRYGSKIEERRVVTLQLSRPDRWRWGDNSNIVEIVELEYVPPTVAEAELEQIRDKQPDKYKSYTRGKQFGDEYKSHYENGQLKTIGYFKDGKRTGEWKWYYKNGQLASSGRFKDGMPDGIQKEYYENGRLESVLYYKNGTVYGKFEKYHENGRLAVSGYYNKTGEADGKWMIYHKNGRLKSAGRYKNGWRVGRWKEYDVTGRAN